MKRTFTSLIAAAILLSVPAQAAAASRVSYSYAYPDGWPKWIDRLETVYHDGKLEMNPNYLPLSLIRTGRYRDMVKEVAETDSVSTHDWPSWIGDVMKYHEGR